MQDFSHQQYQLVSRISSRFLLGGDPLFDLLSTCAAETWISEASQNSTIPTRKISEASTGTILDPCFVSNHPKGLPIWIFLHLPITIHKSIHGKFKDRRFTPPGIPVFLGGDDDGKEQVMVQMPLKIGPNPKGNEKVFQSQETRSYYRVTYDRSINFQGRTGCYHGNLRYPPKLPPPPINKALLRDY